jgi:hypothetical protein
MPLDVQASEKGWWLRSDSRVLGMLPTNSPLTATPSFQRVESVGVAFSLVVNVRGQTYAEIATKRQCGFCQRDEMKRERVPVRLMREADAPALSVAALRNEVRRKVRVPVARWNILSRWKQQDEDKWQRLVSDIGEDVPEQRPPDSTTERNGDIAKMFEQLLTELRELKSFIRGENTKE